VDSERFARALAGLFEDYPRSPHPRDRRFAPILSEVGGLACENNLALLNLTASLLGRGESYVEVGSFKGQSLIAAMLGNAGDFVGIDNFSMEGGDRALLEKNLQGYGLTGHTILAGDALTLLRDGALAGRRVGAYYYDAAHDYRSQLDALRLVEPHLVEGALVIVDDTDWTQVRRALRDYLRSQPRARLLVEIAGKDRGQPWWWEGVQVLRWGSAPPRRRPGRGDVAAAVPRRLARPSGAGKRPRSGEAGATRA
jgi:predicted O-methyltransferase YrrM